MVSFFEWAAAKLSLGVGDMDAEHQTLIGLMNTLYRLNEAGAEAPVVGKGLGEFLNFAVKHFGDEEAYMERIGYPELRIHADVHRTLVGRMTEFAQEFQRSGRLTPQFFMFLKTWLQAHICGVDARYAKFAATAEAAA